MKGTDFTEPITAGIFTSIAAWASYQRSDNETPYWRTLKANGELNSKYPGGIKAQKEKFGMILVTGREPGHQHHYELPL